MAKRYHLKTVDGIDGTIWLTLVYEDPYHFFVEQYNDSRLSFLVDRLKIIRIDDLCRYEFEGVSLVDLVEQKLAQIGKIDGVSFPMIRKRFPPRRDRGGTGDRK